MKNLEIVSVLSNRVEAIIQIVKITIQDNRFLGVHQDAGPGHRYIRRETGLDTSPYLDDFFGKRQGKVVLGLQVQGDGSVYAGRTSRNQQGRVRTSSISGYSSHRFKNHDEFGDSVFSERSGGGNYTNCQDCHSR